MHVKGDFGASPRLAFSPDRKNPLLAVAGGPATDLDLKVYDGADLKLVKTLAMRAASVAFNSDGRFLAAGGSALGKPNDVRIWDTTTWQELAHFQGHTDAVTAVAFNPRTGQLASGSADRSVRLHDLGKKSPVHILGPHPDQVSSIAFSPDGRRLVVAGQGVVKLWDAESGAEVLTLPRPLRDRDVIINGVAFSPDGQRIVAVDLNGAVIVWEAMAR